jgi:glucosamine 6-phosphate synthetase-like amidotransferase/phosphosugar isomerase protein
MCGIVGLVNFKGLTQEDLDYFKYVLVLSEARGTDATGVGLQNLEVEKAPIRASEFVKTKQFNQIIKKAVGQQWIIGHTRHGTQGPANINSNNHPLRVYNKALVAHNGIVHTDKLKEDKSVTDSYIIVSALKKKWGSKSLQEIVKEAYTLFYGYAATIVSSKKSIVFSAINNPLNSGVLPNGSLVFASQPSFFPNGTGSVFNFSSGDSIAYNTQGRVTSTNIKMGESPKPVYNWDSFNSRDAVTEDEDYEQTSLFSPYERFRVDGKKKKKVKVSSYYRGSYYGGWD